jgi:DNA-binding beta-propeller fold protein YncE
VIRIDGADRATTFVDATQLTTPITARDLERPGVLSLEVVTPGPGGGTAARSLDVRAAAPVIGSLPSYGATAGWPGFTLTVDGTRFLPGTVVTWNGAERRTTYRSASRLDVFITTADVATPTVARIAVRNPSAGSGPGPTSAEVPFAVRALPAVAMTGYLALDIPANDLAWDPVTRRLYASVASSGGALAHSVAAIDPTTGTVTGSVAMGSEPGWLVISDDGQYLHASVAGGTAIRRVRVAPLAAERQFSVGAGLVVTALAAVPGQPLAVAAVRGAPCCGTPEAPPGFAIYDDGAPRQKVAPISAGSIAPRDATTFYAQDFSSSAFHVYDLSAGPDGVAVRRTGSSLATWSGVRITYASGRLYTTTGVVIDPDEMRRVAALPFGFDNKSVYVDPALGRLFFRDGATSSLSVVDLNGYQTLGTAYFPRAVPTDDLALGIPPRLVRWGADGFAFRTRGRVYLFRLAAAAP